MLPLCLILKVTSKNEYFFLSLSFLFLSLFTHSNVVSNLYDFLSYVEHERRYFEECRGGEMYNYISAMHHTFCEAADSLAIAFPHTFAISSWLSIFLSVFHTVIGLASAYKL